MTHESSGSPEEPTASTDGEANVAIGPTRTMINQILWWLKLVQVRFRFLIVVVVAAAIVSQWTKLQSLWDRWIWNSTSAASIHGASDAHEFFCPMDPGVLSTWPAICPICNMDLVPRRKADAQLLPEGVVARMQITPYRIQLAGIRTAAVEPMDLQYQLLFTGTLKMFAESDVTQNAIGLDVVPSARDAALLDVMRFATVTLSDGSGVPCSATAIKKAGKAAGSAGRVVVRIVLDDPAAIPSGTAVTATMLIPAVDVLASDNSRPTEMGENQLIFVPESAIVDRGDQHLVYVESMPGMFDGTAVTVGRRIGSYYPVLSGLHPGQRVASSGAFLIDAESRLNPSVAAGYFGANSSALTSSSATSPIAPLRKTDTKSDQTELSAEDQRIVDHQRICPVTELALDSMGGPIPVMIGERKVFICCAGCERRLRDEPEKYLSKIPQTR